MTIDYADSVAGDLGVSVKDFTSGHGLLIASCIRTTHPLGPLTGPVQGRLDK